VISASEAGSVAGVSRKSIAKVVVLISFWVSGDRCTEIRDRGKAWWVAWCWQVQRIVCGWRPEGVRFAPECACWLFRGEGFVLRENR
jgi:hypothetical protein